MMPIKTYKTILSLFTYSVCNEKVKIETIVLYFVLQNGPEHETTSLSLTETENETLFIFGCPAPIHFTRLVQYACETLAYHN